MAVALASLVRIVRRARRRALEALFDVARHLLAKGKGLAGLEYREVANLAKEHGLIEDSELADHCHAMDGYRNRLTHHYDKVTAFELFGILTMRLGDIAAIAESLRAAAAKVMTQFLDGEWGRGLLLEYVFLEVVTVLMALRGAQVAS